MWIRTGFVAALVAFGVATAALTATQAGSHAADRRSAADSLVAFSEALRDTAHDDRAAHIRAGTEQLRATDGFINGDTCLSGAYYRALYGSDADLRAARDFLDSYMILHSQRLPVGASDSQQLAVALDLLQRYESSPEDADALAAAVSAVTATGAFAAGDVNLSEAVCRLGFALENPTRGWWFVPLTARHEAHRAAGAIRKALS